MFEFYSKFVCGNVHVQSRFISRLLNLFVSATRRFWLLYIIQLSTPSIHKVLYLKYVPSIAWAADRGGRVARE